MTKSTRWLKVSLLAILACGCGDDDSGNVSEAIQRGVGAECTVDIDCITLGASCLTQFKGGYCGLANCAADPDCPQGSLCVAHDDGVNYCFLTCADKVDCNLGRTPDNEANCVANITYVASSTQGKACVPPNGG